MLQENKGGRSPSGMPTDNWQDVGEIDVAVYQNNDLITTANTRYGESTHTGLTYCKNIQKGKNRLVRGKAIYTISSCNTTPRITNLLLREVSDV